MDTMGSAPQMTTADFKDVPADRHALFIRGLLFGLGGVVLGIILYSAVGIITGLEIGFVSLAVGYIVGKAILLGSRGVGGRRYQIAAVLLTYASVSVSAVPVAVWQFAKADKPAAVTDTVPPADATVVAAGVTEPSTEVGLLGALGLLVLLGLASPFLGLSEPGSGIIGLIILAVGMRIAWRLTASGDQAVPIGEPALVPGMQRPVEKPTTLDLH